MARSFSDSTPIGRLSPLRWIASTRHVGLGAVLELTNFQLGFVMRVDRAPGEDETGWIYNDKIWHSFAIGYSFLNSATRWQPPALPCRGS